MNELIKKIKFIKARARTEKFKKKKNPKKNHFWNHWITPPKMGQISISRTVLKTSGCEDSENDLTFSIWPSFGWVIGLQSQHVKSAIFQDIGLDLTLITVLFAVRLALWLLDNCNSIKLLYCVSEFFKQIFWEHDITWTTGPILMKEGEQI